MGAGLSNKVMGVSPSLDLTLSLFGLVYSPFDQMKNHEPPAPFYFSKVCAHRTEPTEAENLCYGQVVLKFHSIRGRVNHWTGSYVFHSWFHSCKAT